MNTTTITFRPLTQKDWKAVAEIYQQGIATNNATFRKEVPTWEEWNNGHLEKCRIVAVIEQKIVGWAALTPVAGSCFYAGVAEVSVYIAAQNRGQNIGTALLERLIFESEQENFWTLQSSIFPENTSSLVIHEKVGFRKIGYREKISKMNGQWRDTVLLERRSKTVGAE
jgi:L-amino acid N-acyltransferase YncA